MATHKFNKTRSTTWEIDESGDTWILGEKGRIINASTFGIHADNTIAAATVRIDGEIDMDDPLGRGVFLESESGRIKVSEGARVFAAQTALNYFNWDGTANIANSGVLRGYYGIVAATDQDSADIRNDGRILAGYAGIGATGGGADIINSGLIKASYGISLHKGANDVGQLAADKATHILNTGNITGSTGSIFVDSVAVNIRNKGALSGDIFMAAGDDVVNNRSGTINGNIWGSNGNDVFKMAGGTMIGDIYGGDGNDVISVAGSKFSGLIYGGSGDDVVTLGSSDTFYHESLNAGLDTVRINSTYQLGANIENLILLGKADHKGAGNDLNNELTGNKGANSLYGFGGDDSLFGGAGGDKLFGQDGNDRLDGGRGSDTLTGGFGADIFAFNPGNGRDTIIDFQHGVDDIDLSAYDPLGLVDWMSQVGDDVVIAFSDTDQLVLRNVQMDSLDEFDFIF